MTTKCAGLNCTSTDGTNHSPECRAEHAAAVAGGRFVKGDDAKPLGYINPNEMDAFRDGYRRWIAVLTDKDGIPDGYVPVFLATPSAPAVDAGARADALGDSAYCAGLQQGFTLGQMDDNEGLRKALEARQGYLAVLRESRAALSAKGETNA